MLAIMLIGRGDGFTTAGRAVNVTLWGSWPWIESDETVFDTEEHLSTHTLTQFVLAQAPLVSTSIPFPTPLHVTSFPFHSHANNKRERETMEGVNYDTIPVHFFALDAFANGVLRNQFQETYISHEVARLSAYSSSGLERVRDQCTLRRSQIPRWPLYRAPSRLCRASRSGGSGFDFRLGCRKKM